MAHEIFLVHPRGELDDLGRDFEVVLLEPAEQRHGPFGQPGILDHQPLVLDERQPGFGGDRGSAFADQILPLAVIDDHVRRAQLDRVVVGIADGDVARMVEAVAERDRAAGDAVHLAFDDIVAE